MVTKRPTTRPSGVERPDTETEPNTHSHAKKEASGAIATHRKEASERSEPNTHSHAKKEASGASQTHTEKEANKTHQTPEKEASEPTTPYT